MTIKRTTTIEEFDNGKKVTITGTCDGMHGLCSAKFSATKAEVDPGQLRCPALDFAFTCEKITPGGRCDDDRQEKTSCDVISELHEELKTYFPGLYSKKEG